MGASPKLHKNAFYENSKLSLALGDETTHEMPVLDA